MRRFRQSATEQVLAIDGVVSVGEGLRNGQRVMVVGVRSPEIADDPRIPTTLDGLQVVTEVEDNPGFAAARPPLAGQGGGLPRPVSAAHVQRTRPVPPGVSIGHPDVTAGTSSFLLTDGSTVYQASNSHVLALYGDAAEGDPIVQPGVFDGGDPERDTVGSLAGSVPVSGNNLLDLAWYEPSPDAGVTDEIISLNRQYDADVADPDLGDTVVVVGRTSGVVEATIDRINTTVEMQTGERFIDQARLSIPLLGGDSGSPIFLKTNSGLKPAGMGFASTQTNGYINLASNIESETGLRIVKRADDGGVETSADGDRNLAPLLIGGGVAAWLFL